METNKESQENNLQPEINTLAKKSTNAFHLGYGLLLVSFSLFLLYEFFNPESKESDSFTIFFIHYLISIAYLVILVTSGISGLFKIRDHENIHRIIILCNLYLVSAYALNRSLPVFEDSADWFCMYIIASSLTLLSFRYFDSLPVWINRLQYLLLGSVIVLYLYLLVYAAPFYFVGSVGILFFGIGLHIFIPLGLFLCCIVLIRYTFRNNKISYYWILAGFCMTVGLTATFIIEWKSRISKIETMANQSVLSTNNELPVWVKVAGSLQNDWISQRILKSDLVYTVSKNKFENWSFMPGKTNWEEQRKHDPLVFLASIFSTCSLADEDRVKILQTISDTRHQAHKRLWTGDNLTTSYIVSDIDIYPNLRLAYTEKYLNVKNNDTRRWWGSREEAIYTFQLPEGSVITSLSLWINNREEKGILTSKQKAGTAYKTIVGVEQRDPSVVHWQEGNTVTVRVFPCTEKEERKFKLGITSPLMEKNGRILYKNITFRGPNAVDAIETTRIRLIGSSEDISTQGAFKKDKKGDFISEGKYNPDFSLSFKALPVTDNRFSFNGDTYSLQSYEQDFQQTTVNEIYLDINNSWTRDDIESLKELTGKYKMYAYVEDAFVQTNETNWEELTGYMYQRNFSLFPFHLIKDFEHSLVITTGKELSPHLSDFKESDFAKSVSKFFADGKKVKVYNLNGAASTYISSFREFRGLEYAGGSPETLKAWLQKKIYPLAKETDHFIVLHDAGLSISKQKTTGALPDNAPDHLARLFAYNDIMRKVGANYFKDDFINEELVDEAATAYVVSPISSLIVLETKEDYERFGIKDKNNSLHNASKNSSGAVPEPHEWALIILFLLFMAYTIRQSKLRAAI